MLFGLDMFHRSSKDHTRSAELPDPINRVARSMYFERFWAISQIISQIWTEFGIYIKHTFIFVFPSLFSYLVRLNGRGYENWLPKMFGPRGQKWPKICRN